MKNAKWMMILLALSMASFACGTDGEGEGEGEGEESFTEEICEHLDEGPAESVSADANVSEAHTRFDAELVPGENSFIFNVDEAADYVIAIRTDIVDVPVLAATQGGAGVPEVEFSLSEFDCDVTQAFRASFEIGTAEFSFLVGQDNTGTVSFVIEEFHEAEEDEE